MASLWEGISKFVRGPLGGLPGRSPGRPLYLWGLAPPRPPEEGSWRPYQVYQFQWAPNYSYGRLGDLEVIFVLMHPQDGSYYEGPLKKRCAQGKGRATPLIACRDREGAS
jgi:hypothetical protein